MSETSEKKKTLAGWTMVDSKGEVMTESVSSDSSSESFSLLQEDSARDASSSVAVTESPSGEVNDEFERNCRAPSTLSCPEEIPLPVDLEEVESSRLSKSQEPIFKSSGFKEVEDYTRQQSPNEIMSDGNHSASPDREGPEENNGSLGACCKELMKSISNPKNQPIDTEECKDVEVEDKEGRDDSAISSLLLDNSIPSPSFQGVEDREQRQRHNSDSDSDFVQINEENLEDFEAELINSRHVIPDRSPSIAEGFNFLRPEGIQDELQGNGNISDRDFDEDFNEDTESSTEDVGDDRIESDQSEVGSIMNNNPTDVGDLSAFADIGDLPLIAGNVARNYRHRPNKGLSSILNLILIVVSLLTMGISIGLIMATDLEIEEWQNAYNMQVKKTSSLEWTLADLNRVMQESKDKVNAYESVLKSFSKAEIQEAGSFVFFTSFADIVTKFELCTKKHGSLSSVDCHAQVLPNIRHSLFQFKETIKTLNSGDASVVSAGGLGLVPPIEKQENSDRVRTISTTGTGVPTKEEQIQDFSNDQDLHELRLSLHREQERALHWQNLYLLERRQREWERENEMLEDQRERAQWEKEDEEEDRKMRENWEREEAENDRIERLLWEREDQEQDRQEREKWEKERAEIDNLECLKKLMTTNITSFKRLVMNWNISAFDDFVNISMLMSSIAEMKQSVLTSVQQIWIEAEQALNKMGEDVKKGKQPHLDTSVMADYLKQALSVLRSQFDDVVHEHTNIFSGNKKADISKEPKTTNDGGNKNNDHDKNGFEDNYENTAGEGWKNNKGKESSTWNKVFGKIFKKTSKSLRKFVRTVSSSWTKVVNHWENKASFFMKSEEGAPKGSEKSFSFPFWLQGKACNNFRDKQDILVDIGSPCLWDVRDSFVNHFLQQHCNHRNRYSRACNNDASAVWQLKRDLIKILDTDENFRANRMTFVDGPNILGLFSEFWRKWENSDLLLKSDKDWSSCLLREWSDAVYSKGGWTTTTGKRCHRSVQLNTVVMDIDSRISYSNAMVYEDDVTVEDEDDDFDEDTHDMNDKYNSHSQLNEGNEDSGDEERDNENHIYEDSSDDEFKNNNFDYVDSEHYETTSSGKNPSDKVYETKSNSSFREEGENDHYKQTVWYLKRAQYRLEMRRAQEKANWFFDMSDHREEMRREHNIEKKSGQWIFDQAQDREAQRKKDHEADWVFERARHRRKEFSREWSQVHHPHKYRKHENAHICNAAGGCNFVRGKLGKMEDLSKSDWLLQNNRRSQGKGTKRGGKKGRVSLNNWHGKKKNGNKHPKQHRGKQHKNKKRFQKSPKH